MLVGQRPSPDNQETCVDDLDLVHVACLQPLMTIRRDQISHLYTLKCQCGLVVELGGAVAEEALYRTAIDELSRPLPKGSFSSNRSGAVTLVAGHTHVDERAQE